MNIAILFLAVLSLRGYAATIHANFEGGSLEHAEEIAANHFRVSVKGETDQAGRNRQASWYFFRVDGAPREEIILDIVNLPGEYNYRPNRGAITGDTPPVISYDRKTWTHVRTFEYDPKEPRLRLRVKPSASTFWIAHTPPYTNQDLAALRKELLRHRDFREETVGTTPSGRPLYLWTIQNGRPRKTVWLMARQHSWESGTSWVAEGALRALLADDAHARELRDSVAWKILPMCDPDGVARGGVRFNAKGYDLNRNWDIGDSPLMPEIAAQRRAIARWVQSGKKIDLFLTLHNTETAEYLEGPPDGGATTGVRTLAEALFGALAHATTFDPSQPLSYAARTTTENMPGRMTVTQGLYRDFQIPAFLMEQRIAFNPKLGHLPEIPDRLAFGKQLVLAIASTLREVGTK
jgi:hypothetical protein